MGDEDDPELLTDTIRYLYRHGRVHDQLQGLDDLFSIDGLIDIYQLADKYDIPILRQSAVNRLPVLAYRVIHIPTNTTHMRDFVDCIARVCGPDSLQFADNTLKTMVLKICQTYAVSLLKRKMFFQRYTRGELFDVGSATAFGVELSGRLLTSKGTAAGDTDGFPNVKLSTMDPCTTDRYVKISISLCVLKAAILIETSLKVQDQFLRRRETIRHRRHLSRQEDIGSQDHPCNPLVLPSEAAYSLTYSQLFYRTFLESYSAYIKTDYRDRPW